MERSSGLRDDMGSASYSYYIPWAVQIVNVGHLVSQEEQVMPTRLVNAGYVVLT